jgi:SAM-dependent methyltransferase
MQTNDEQKTLWNGTAGHAWVELDAVLDRMLAGFTDLLLQGARIEPAHCVLDIGCGTGNTTLAVARSLGGPGRCVGVDISEPMTSVARARAEQQRLPATFICADAATYAFEPDSFDAMISRFGVMFFDDSVQAFANLRRAAKPGAEIRFVAWQGLAENPFMTIAERAARPLLPELPERSTDAPGQFAFADDGRVSSILEQAGWMQIEIVPREVASAFPEKDLVRYFTRVGPLGRVLQAADDQTRFRIVETVRAAFDPYVFGEDVRFTSACWVVSARKNQWGKAV